MRNKSSFAGNMKSYAVSKISGGAANTSRARLADLLRALNLRMDTVSVEHQSYEQCLANYDAPTTFFFVDPPYLNCRVQTYRGWTEKEMQQLAQRLDALAGNWVLTVDDSPYNRELFARHEITAITRPNGCVNQKLAHNRSSYGELVIERKR